MSLKSIVNAVALGVIAGTGMLPTATTAEARDGRGRYEHNGSFQKGWKSHGRQAWGHDRGHYRHHGHRGRNVALGAFAAVLGLAIAAEAAGARDDAYYDYDD